MSDEARARKRSGRMGKNQTLPEAALYADTRSQKRLMRTSWDNQGSIRILSSLLWSVNGFVWKMACARNLPSFIVRLVGILESIQRFRFRQYRPYV